MKKLFDNVSEACSKMTTQTYSTSFSLGIKFLDKKYHNPIYGIYGFVRFADEIVDSFDGYDKVELLKKFKQDTIESIKNGISLNPILNSFQNVVHQYKIDWELIDTFLKSMEMDLTEQKHDARSYDQYILGSAEVVGLMCLKVFTDGNQTLFNELKPFAMKLGAAFQKVNFLRDINQDFKVLGRVYFPDVHFDKFSQKDKLNIQTEIENDFNEALIGIRKLPKGSRRGVYLAYYYYRKLFNKIKDLPAEKVVNARIRIPDFEKAGLMLKSMIRLEFGIL